MKLQIMLILASLITFIYVISRIKKHQLNIDDSLLWIVWSLVLLILSLFPKLSRSLADFFGFESTSNFILTTFVFLIYIMVFFQNIKISELKEKNKRLIQRISIDQNKNNRK